MAPRIFAGNECPFRFVLGISIFLLMPWTFFVFERMIADDPKEKCVFTIRSKALFSMVVAVFSE